MVGVALAECSLISGAPMPSCCRGLLQGLRARRMRHRFLLHLKDATCSNCWVMEIIQHSAKEKSSIKPQLILAKSVTSAVTSALL